MTGGIGDDLISGGKGNDTLNGKNGNDVYTFNRGEGDDTISETVDAGNAGGMDTIAFGAKIRVDDLQFARAAGNLTIELRYQNSTSLSGESIVVNGWTTISNQVEVLSFADGTVLDISGSTLSTGAASAGLDIIDAGTGNNNIDALDGNDIVLARAGNDTVHGSRGHDYIDGSDGNDILYGDEDDDTLLGGRGDGSDKLYGGAGDDYLDGERGNDTLQGSGGEDQLYGGEGSDTLAGEEGDDIIVGGMGSDQLNGGIGDDIYLIERGDGVDTIWDSGSDDDYSMSGSTKNYDNANASDRTGDRLVFAYDIRLTDLAFDFNSTTGDLSIGIARDGLIPTIFTNIADRVTIKYWNNLDARIERINFFDGSVLYMEEVDGASSGNNSSNTYDGTSINNLIAGGDSADTINGNGGDDVILGGRGYDKLQGQDGEDALFGGDGNDELRGGRGDDRLFGGDGNDTIFGNGDGDPSENGDDYIAGGAGDDTLNGGDDHDTYFFNYGDGIDVITEETQTWNYDSVLNGGPDFRENTIALGSGIWFSDIKVTNSGSQLQMELLPLNRPTELATTITMEKHAIRQLGFANGYYAHFGDIANGRWGTDADDVFDYTANTKAGVWLNGNGGDDTMKGGAGRDVLIGGEGNDILYGGKASDYYVFNAYDGRDTIFEGVDSGDRVAGGASDSIAFGPGITLFDLSMKLATNGDLVISIRDNDRQDFDPENAENSIRIKGWQGETNDHRIEWLDFSYGSSFEIGEIGRAVFKGPTNSTITGTVANEWMEGGTGGDTIDGGAGNDVIFGRDGYDSIAGGDGADQIYGESGFDTLRGGNGHDQIFGGDGEDTIIDSQGSDWLYGGGANDTIEGGQGSNLYNGGEGDDTIKRGGFVEVSSGMDGQKPVRQISATQAVSVVEFGRGDGNDTLVVQTPADATLNGVHDHIDLIGVSREEVWFEKVGTTNMDLKLRILGTQDQMIFVDFFKGDNYKFAQVNAGGQTLDHWEIASLVQEMSSLTPNVGTSGAGLTSSELPDALLTLIEEKWDKYTPYEAA